MGPQLAPYIKDSCTLISQRGVWCTFEHPHFKTFGVVNVYAPTEADGSKERTLLWGELSTALPNSIPWMLVGDFNMVEHLADQKGGTPQSPYAYGTGEEGVGPLI
jgi:hypothetical protein